MPNAPCRRMPLLAMWMLFQEQLLYIARTVAKTTDMRNVLPVQVQGHPGNIKHRFHYQLPSLIYIHLYFTIV